MKKSSLFISAVLTTFVLAVLGGVFTVLRTFTGSTPASVLQSTPMASAIPATPTIPGAISPQEAAQIAARYTGNSDLYAVESALFSGMNTYKVTFSSGNVAYVDLQGQVQGIFLAPQPRISANSSVAPSDSSPSNSLPSNPDSSEEHEGGD